MSRAVVLGLACFALALGMEQGVLALFANPTTSIQWNEMRLVALMVVLAGCLRSDVEAALFAVFCAIPYGAIIGPGYWGCTIVAFAAAACAASWSARSFFLDNFLIRLLVLWGLLLGESWIWSATRHLFWPATHIEIQWRTHFIAALFGTMIFHPLAGALRHRPVAQVPIGRKKHG